MTHSIVSIGLRAYIIDELCVDFLTYHGCGGQVQKNKKMKVWNWFSNNVVAYTKVNKPSLLRWQWSSYRLKLWIMELLFNYTWDNNSINNPINIYTFFWVGHQANVGGSNVGMVK
jgi:hypothetical protein